MYIIYSDHIRVTGISITPNIYHFIGQLFSFSLFYGSGKQTQSLMFLGKYSTTELYPSPIISLFMFRYVENIENTRCFEI
jgi:hypothetical protein